MIEVCKFDLYGWGNEDGQLTATFNVAIRHPKFGYAEQPSRYRAGHLKTLQERDDLREEHHMPKAALEDAIAKYPGDFAKVVATPLPKC